MGKVFILLALFILTSFSSESQTINRDIEKLKLENETLRLKVELLELKLEKINDKLTELLRQMQIKSVSPSSAVPLGISSPSNSVPQREAPKQSYSGQCKAITKKGTQCSRSAGPNGYCWQH